MHDPDQRLGANGSSEVCSMKALGSHFLVIVDWFFLTLLVILTGEIASFLQGNQLGHPCIAEGSNTCS